MEMQFLIAVDSSASEDELLEWIADRITGSVRDRGYLRVGNNVMKVDENDNFGERPGEDDKDALWLYYRYYLVVFPVNVEKVDVKQQRLLAEQLCEVLTARGASVELVAEFDEMC